MKSLFLLLLLVSFSNAIVPEETQECTDLYNNANAHWQKLSPLLKTKIASKYAWDLLHEYLDAASETIATCEETQALNFRYIRELKQGMKRADSLRNVFWTQTYNAMVEKARREGRCTNIYNSYGPRK